MRLNSGQDSTKRILEKVSYKRTGGKGALFLTPFFSSLKALSEDGFLVLNSQHPRLDWAANTMLMELKRKNLDA